MSARHLETRAGEHLNLDDSRKSATKNHLRSCHHCCNKVGNVTSFTILRKCRTDYERKIHEALLTKKKKKLRPQLNKELYGKGGSCLICFKHFCANICVVTIVKLIVLKNFLPFKKVKFL